MMEREKKENKIEEKKKSRDLRKEENNFFFFWCQFRRVFSKAVLIKWLQIDLPIKDKPSNAIHTPTNQ